ncbi:MAG TPA: PilZ domain-containing protein [Acidimicrobiales bacterium]|nr:PilZ domain-containing protein [Acidimicrobiales bacterium]
MPPEHPQSSVEATSGEPPVLQPGVRVSIELPEEGTCVAVVSSSDGQKVELDLLDELPDANVAPGSALGIFLPRSAGIYHWPCTLQSLKSGPRAEVQILGEPLFVQRRVGQRWESRLEAAVRRVRSARRSTAHLMRVVDLSRGGLKLEGPFQLSTGDTLEVTVDLSPEVQLVGRAVMAYPTSARNWAAHVSFLDGQGDALDVVAAYITRRAQRAGR